MLPECVGCLSRGKEYIWVKRDRPTWVTSCSQQWYREKCLLEKNIALCFYLLYTHMMGPADLVLTSGGFCCDPSAWHWTECSLFSHLLEYQIAQQQGSWGGIPSLGRMVCRAPRVTVTASSMEVTLTGITLDYFSAWHRSKLLTHVQMPDLLQSPKLILSMAAVK